ncbi:bifunctional diaminohydroxyphosphoribosylaminopyrimidine deaminase/5-amino-6-(5-phosphoribosylamino)uracil reductase RibD [Konateibacter massiliensis]|uniref:bifunctional diaminohydroxyphosphoribosylaminopyrimidine deaminase/5-amino-6-(5-phosphoribosylamino)uracil reductase RibD n=1 Tax=Konateibacter massiliensis TaxID=2002841 RepID=UPI000C14FF4D|nr:bifunctional diaminohydroxyphosphoribosylaminopyrimidine deaminase/5-amino-6-(5-phosphoribosylamino)uracil reductase RibD [Konateibacter massiliensis]
MHQEDYMKMAIELAKKGRGFVSPNPLVGAVIVKDKAVIGQGFHEKYGSPHAERNAINSCVVSPKGGTLYVTLEPCCHYGKTPPCTDAIIESGIKKVVIGSFDPNPLVSQKGIAILREHGIEVVEHVCREECERLNKVFFHFIKTKMPYVTMKYAMTLDGKIATFSGKSKWITAETARAHVQQERHNHTAIMVGVGTVLLDDPLLTCRMEGGVNPVRVICDSSLQTPLTAQVIVTAKEIPTIIATSCNDLQKWKPYEQAGCELLAIPPKGKHLDLPELMRRLGEKSIDSILLEGGAALNWSALNERIVNKVCCYIAPKLFGGENAKTPVGGMGVEKPSDAFLLKNSIVMRLGEDMLIESEVEYPCLQEL